MRAYVINLARSPERRRHVLAELKRTGMEYKLVTGVDARAIDISDPGMVDQSIFAHSWFRPGMPGCVLSHVRAYRSMLADGADRALVLEDDVVLPPDLDALCQVVGAQLSGAEAALLSYDCAQQCKLARHGMVRLSSERDLALPADVGELRSGGAYVITREACERMSDRLVPVRARADDWGYFCREGLLDRVRCVVPQAVQKSPEFGSTMQSDLKARLNRVPLVRYAVAQRRQRLWRPCTRVEIIDTLPAEIPGSSE